MKTSGIHENVMGHLSRWYENGKTNLTDKAWHSPTNAFDRFFTVGVEMR